MTSCVPSKKLSSSTSFLFTETDLKLIISGRHVLNKHSCRSRFKLNFARLLLESESIMKETPLLKLIQSRRSIRRFSNKVVLRDDILTCIEAARHAPSAENMQPWRFIVLDNQEIIQEFGDTVFTGIYRYTRWAAAAPVIIAMFTKMDILVNRLGHAVQGTQYYLLDLGIAGEHFVLQAHELGIGTCWIGWFNSKNARRFFNLKRNYRAVALIAMGYPENPPKRKRKMLSLEEIVRFNKERE
jgi:nitroreductase